MRSIKAFPLAALLVLAQSAPLFSEAGHDGDIPKLSLYASQSLASEDEGAAQSPVVFSLRGPGATSGPFALRPEDLASIKAWQVQIFDFYGNKVGFVQGKGQPTQLDFPWSGFSADGKPLKDGSYTARFVWSDAQGFHKTEDATAMLMAPAELKGLYGFDLRFVRTAKGLSIRIGGDLLFAAGRYDIQAQVLPTLAKIADLLHARERNKVLVRGFTDSVGTLAANLVLSQKRAQAVYRFLAEHGIASERMAYEGLGSQEAIDSNATDAGRQRNRRVEVVVLDERI